MQLSAYFSNEDNGRVSFTREQASEFAKRIAGDFNPIHDVDSKRFCVPGDLLFSVALNKLGVSQKMRFIFSGMVVDGVEVSFPATDSSSVVVSDDNDKEYLTIEREGGISQDEAFIRGLTENYVAFSGQTFPHILVPLMASKGVMINTDRPLVIYESMEININHLTNTAPTLELAESVLDVDGKRGKATLKFNLIADGEVIGTGAKSMLLSGLREFDEAKIQVLVDEYSARKEAY